MTRSSVVGVLVGLALVLAGCTGPHDAPTARSSAAPAPPPTLLGTLEGVDDTGANDWVEDLAADGDEVVGVGRVLSWRSAPTFRRSVDGGRTWREGALDDASWQQTPLASSEYPTAVAHGPEGWVALGFEDRAVAWTSADGSTWARHELPPAVADPATDEVADLVSSGSGFVAVGSRTVGSRTVPLAWSSTDGVGWTRRSLPGAGGPAAVAAAGPALVAVGRTEGAHEDARAWRSGDGGQTWSSVRVPRPPKDGDFERSLTSVTATARGFTAVGSAWTDDWTPTLYRSRDGSRWTYDRGARALDLGVAADGPVLAPGDDTVVAAETVATFDKVLLWARVGTSWLPAQAPLEMLRSPNANWYPYGIVRTDAGWVTSVVEEDNGRLRGHLWFSTDGRSFEAVDAGTSRWAVATSAASDLARAGGSAVAVGRSRGLPVVWPVGPDPGATVVPVVLEHDERYSVDGASGSGDAVVAWGSDLGGNSRYATVWISTDRQTFRRSRAGSFGTAHTYGYSEIASVRRVGGRWIAVGEQSTNGSAARSALLATSTDGLRWTAGRSGLGPTPVRVRMRDDITDLAGADDHLRRINDVVLAGARPLAVGWAGATGAEHPATWASLPDRRGREVWLLQTLPLAGFAAGAMTYVEAGGQHVVVLGNVRRRGSATSLPYVWVSDSAGVRWTGSLLPLGGVDPAHLDLDGLVRTPHAYVVVANAEADVGRPAAWRSDDGRRWEPLALPEGTASPGEDVHLFGVEARGDELVGLLRRRTAAGTGTTLFRQVVR